MKELMNQFKTEKEIEEEFERRKRYHSNKLSLGKEESAQEVAELLSLMDMQSGDTEHLASKNEPNTVTQGKPKPKDNIAVLITQKPDLALKFFDTVLKHKEKLPQR